MAAGATTTGLTDVEDLRTGEPRRIGGYDVEGRLGRGGMGTVYLARTPTGRRVAVKVVHPHLAADPHFRDRFRHEVDAAVRVGGGRAVEVVSADPDGDPPWMAVQYVPGPTLAEAVADAGPLPGHRVWELVVGVAEALVAIHDAGVVHRDLKPSNVILGADGPTVIDFGIARAADVSRVTHTGTVLGTAGFMSPEQVNGLPVGSAGDVFSFGALLCFAATGRAPFGTGSPSQQMYRILHAAPDFTGVADPLLRQVVAGCLRRAEDARLTPQQILAFAQRADRAAAPGPGGPVPAGRPDGVLDDADAPTRVAPDDADTPTVLAPEVLAPEVLAPEVPAPARDPGQATGSASMRRRTALLATAAALGLGVPIAVTKLGGWAAPSMADPAATPSSTSAVPPATASAAPAASTTVEPTELDLILSPPPSAVIPARFRRKLRRLYEIPEGESVTIQARFSPDGRRLATSDADGVRVWDVSRGSPRLLHFHRQDTSYDRMFAYGPGDLLAITPTSGQPTEVVEATTGRVRLRLTNPADLATGELAFSGDGRLLAASSAVWALPAGKKLYDDFTLSTVFSPVAPVKLTAATDTGSVAISEALTDKMIREVYLLGNTDPPYSVSVSRNGKAGVAGTRDGQIWFFSVAAGEARQGYGTQGGDMVHVACSPDGTLAASVGRDGLSVWDAGLTRVVASDPDCVDTRWVDWAPDRQHLAVSGDNGAVYEVR